MGERKEVKEQDLKLQQQQRSERITEDVFSAKESDDSDEEPEEMSSKTLKVSDEESGSDSDDDVKETPGNDEPQPEDTKQDSLTVPVSATLVEHDSMGDVRPKLETAKLQMLVEDEPVIADAMFKAPEAPIAVNDPEQMERSESVVSTRSVLDLVDDLGNGPDNKEKAIAVKQDDDAKEDGAQSEKNESEVDDNASDALELID